MKRSLVLFCAVLLCALQAYADPGIVIAVDQGNLPFMFEQPEGAGGIYPDLLHAVFSRMDVAVTVTSYPWKRALKMGKIGDVGIGGIYKTEKRLKVYDYSEPLYTERVLLYVRKEAPFAFHTYADLEGKVIGALLGWSYGEAIDRVRRAGGLNVCEVPNDEKNFQKLVNGRLDAVLALELTGNLFLSREEYKDRIVALEKPVAVNETFLAFAKCSKKRRLLDRFNEALQAMKADGSYDRVIRPYLSTEMKKQAAETRGL